MRTCRNGHKNDVKRLPAYFFTDYQPLSCNVLPVLFKGLVLPEVQKTEVSDEYPVN